MTDQDRETLKAIAASLSRGMVTDAEARIAARHLEALASRKPPEGTVRVRAAVGINLEHRDYWHVSGKPSYDTDSERDMKREVIRNTVTNDDAVIHFAWIEADVPLPVPQTIQAEVQPLPAPPAEVQNGE